jgi:uncharacterized phage-associated protein
MEPAPSRQAREKLLDAIIFFTTRTKKCYKTKLFKLLFLLDFRIYRETGKSVTGLQYFAWPQGPVPRELYEEFDSPKQDLKTAVLLRKADLADPDEHDLGLQFIPRTAFDQSLFTARELRTMERLAEIYRDAKASEMVEVTHLAGQPWHQIFEVEKRPQASIPYELALDSKPDSITREQAELIAEEAREVAALFE